MDLFIQYYVEQNLIQKNINITQAEPIQNLLNSAYKSYRRPVANM